MYKYNVHTQYGRKMQNDAVGSAVYRKFNDTSTLFPVCDGAGSSRSNEPCRRGWCTTIVLGEAYFRNRRSVHFGIV